jgi:hypothetical protein
MGITLVCNNGIIIGDNNGMIIADNRVTRGDNNMIGMG